MTFLVQSIQNYDILLTSVRVPVIKGEPLRILNHIHEKLARLSDVDTVHLVMDIAVLDRTMPVPAQHYITVLARIYEEWHYRQQMTLWVTVDAAYEDTVRYMAQKHLLPLHIHYELPDVLRDIVHHYGKTGELVSRKAQN